MTAAWQVPSAVPAVGPADVGTAQAEYPKPGAAPTTFPRACPQSQGPLSPVLMQAA